MRLLNSIGLMVLMVPTAWVDQHRRMDGLNVQSSSRLRDETACRVMENGQAFEIKLMSKSSSRKR